MQKVFVLDHHQKPLMPCHPARARKLLNRGLARVYRHYPFTIILFNQNNEQLQPIELKFDPGSRTTGIALVGYFKRGYEVIWAGNLNHRGWQIKANLDSRRSIRRLRRYRNIRYRPARFQNRRKPEGWLPPSLCSRVDNISNWTLKLSRWVPLTQLTVETVRFDTQKIQYPEISGIEYQQGELTGYEIREYLLEKWGHQCVYCDAQNVPLEIEHIHSWSKGGSNRVANLTLACTQCNQKKGNQDIKDFLKHQPERLKKIQAYAKAPLRDAAAVNATRYAIGNALKTFGLPISFSSGGRTKFNRFQQGYPKEHWVDAACVGASGNPVTIPQVITPLIITAKGRGSRQKCRMNKYGFPRTGPKKYKQIKGFQTGDIVKAVVTQGKRMGTYVGRVIIRTSGSFDISTHCGKVSGLSSKYFQLIQKLDGYEYSI